MNSTEGSGRQSATRRKDEGDAASLNIDILRSFLAQWVILDHVASVLLPLPLVPGRLAVWGFFIVSGYLNTISMERSKAARPGAPGVWLYYGKRLVRIYPLLIASYLVVSLCVGTLANPDLLTLVPATWFNRVELSNGPLWTLVVEIQLYILTPLLVMAARGLHARARLALLLAGCVTLVYAVPAAHVLLTGELAFIDDRSMAGNAGFYLFGMFMALSRGQGSAKVALPRWLAPALLLAMAVFLALYNFRTVVVTWTMGPAIALGFAYYFLRCRGPVFAWGHPVFRFLGYYTYEIYVLHGLYTFLQRAAGLPPDPLWTLACAWLLPMTTVLLMSRARSLRARRAPVSE